MKNKIIELIKEMSVENVNFVKVCNSNELIDQIQALEFPVTVQEVKEHCRKIGLDCEECITEGRDCPINDHPQKWNIDKINKAVGE